MPLIIGEIVLLEEIQNSQNLKSLKVKVSEEDNAEEPLSIVTNAKNVKQGMKVVVATLGTLLEDEETTVESRTISGVKSTGMLCDNKMCGWGSTNPGLAVSVPDTFTLGSPCPPQNPRSALAQNGPEAGTAGELTIKQKKELEKAARKAALKEKRAEKAAAKKE